jgi:hypothetical protein
MTMYLWNCTGCHKPIARHEPAKVYAEQGRHYFFHSANDSTCFQKWRKEMLLKELTQIERHLKERVDTINDHENWET